MTTNTPTAKPLLWEPSPRDWEEDWAHNNGQYLCRCMWCKLMFMGHKRRVTCRVCAKEGGTE